MDLIAKNLSTQQRMQYIRMCEAVLRKDPKNADALSNIGILLSHVQQYVEAAGYLKRALAVRKNDPKILNLLGENLFMSKQYVESCKIRRKLCELTPRIIGNWLDYIESLQFAGKSNQITAIFEKLERREPDNPDIMNKKADFLRKLGKYEEANVILQAIQKIRPGDSVSLYLYCNSKKFTAQEADEYTKYIEDALSVATDTFAKSQLFYAAGKVWQDCGRHDRAFSYYKQANDLRLEEIDPDFSVPFVNARAVFNRDFLADRQKFGNEADRMIFILGMPRSGTTLTESIAGAHPEITAGDELSYLNDISRTVGLRTSMPEDFLKIMSVYSGSDFAAMAAQYLDATESIATKTRYFTDKLPNNFMNVGLIRLLFPRAKIIHCRRHPVDNCLSIYTNSMRSNFIAYKSDLSTLGLYFRQYWQLMQHWRENIPNAFHEVYYEDLVVNTEYNARRMIDYLGLEWHDSVMNREGSQKTIKTLSAWQARQPIYTSSSGKWRNYEKHLAPLIDGLGPLVEEYEAELETQQAAPIQEQRQKC